MFILVRTFQVHVFRSPKGESSPFFISASTEKKRIFSLSANLLLMRANALLCKVRPPPPPPRSAEVSLAGHKGAVAEERHTVLSPIF